MSTYFAILTQVGEAKLANAMALGGTLVLSKMGVGDGNGVTPVPDRAQTALIHEWRRASLNQISVDPSNASQIIVEQVLPEDVGGSWIREIGIYDEEGDLCAVANCPPSYKPLLAEGSGRTQVVRVVLIVSSTTAITLKIDPSIVLATRKYVDDGMSAHQTAADPHSQYWNDTRGNAKVQAAVNALIAGAPATLDTLKELADAINDDANFSATVLAQLATRPAIYSITALPNTNKGPIIVAECGEVWLWSTSAYFTGYRSPLCGRAIFGHTLVPLVSEFDGIGGILSKTAYAPVWGYAQENGLVVTQTVWTASIGAHYFVDLGGDNFRSPDLRNQFMRFNGTDADTENARTLGSYKADTIKAHSHGAVNTALTTGTGPFSALSDTGSNNSVHTAVTGTAETAPKHTAYAPRIHV